MNSSDESKLRRPKNPAQTPVKPMGDTGWPRALALLARGAPRVARQGASNFRRAVVSKSSALRAGRHDGLVRETVGRETFSDQQPRDLV